MKASDDVGDGSDCRVRSWYYFGTYLSLLIVVWLGLGGGRALSEAGEQGMLVDLAHQIPERRGRILAAQQAAIALGIAINAPCQGIVVEMYRPRSAFYCVTFAATIALTVYAFLPETLVQDNQ